jgi:signal transduction histidine kinase
MRRPLDWSNPWLAYVPAALLVGSVALRSLLAIPVREGRASYLGGLALWLALFLAGQFLGIRRPAFIHLFLALQCVVAYGLMSGRAQGQDYFALVFVVVCMQAMQTLPARSGVAWVGVATVLMALPLLAAYGFPQGVGFLLLYAAIAALLGSYSLAVKRAGDARRANEQLAIELQAANRQVEQMAGRMKALAAARERQHLGRELHDSVTQTVFSLSLAVQSARLLVERQPERVPEHLDHLTALAQQALAQMHALVSELKPGGPAPGELPEALRRHLAAAFLPEGLAIALDVEGESDGALSPEEEQALFAIAREALNNIVKHSGATQARVRLHAGEPPELEVHDNGHGLDPEHARPGVGLPGMSERAADIGWRMTIESAPGAGTTLRVKRTPSDEVTRAGS